MFGVGSIIASIPQVGRLAGFHRAEEKIPFPLSFSEELSQAFVSRFLFDEGLPVNQELIAEPGGDKWGKPCIFWA